ncbi:hypothetical protein DH2020_032327 [Rehmannia glutinosa]|uniref:Uncharacterized protein n=1 Tax=Rehmannia glutinosa TaxID=99300 RepID=A0ABR0VHU2_REHGL
MNTSIQKKAKKLPECKASDVSSPIGNPKTGRESTNLSLGDRAGVNSASASCLRKSVNIRLADLNEPIEIEEAMAPSTVDFLDRNGERKGENQPAKSNAGYLRVSEESIHVRDGSSIKSAVESKVNERGWLSHLYEAGSVKSNLSSVTHGLHKEKMPIPSYPLPGTLNPLEHPPVNVIYPFGHSWAHPVPSWSKPTTSFTQKLTTMEPCLDSPAVSNRSLQTSAPNMEPFRGKWQVNVNSKLNANLGGELTTTNGIFHGSASRSGETKVHLQSAGFDNNFNCSRADNVVSDRSTNHVLGYFPNGSCLGNSRPVIDINLNEAEDGKSEPEDHLSALPWLKRKPAHANETVADLNQPLHSSDCEIVRTAETQNVKKILGFPIFETGALENVPSEKNIGKERKNRIIDINLECEPDEEIAAEEPNFEKEKNETKGVSIRDYIDLNSCVSDCEDASVPSYESKATSVKIAFEIDLEAPVENEEAEENTVGEASLQLLQNKNKTLQDEILRNAAETIFAISSSCPNIHSDNILHPSDASLAESLIWFADVVSSELESTSTVRDGSPRDLLDDFEAMTLQLQETKEEDYMPTPFVPEVQKVEETGPNTLTTRSRRGQSRRGRQRRDFQRDILPGLTTLSRHEVSEDLQTFGGLMRATGHHWVSGSTRRNSGGRGRRRAVIETTVSAVAVNPVCTPLVQQISKIEAGLEDRSLTGWGKTTRRPRRQRCPTGNNNPPAVVLT